MACCVAIAFIISSLYYGYRQGLAFILSPFGYSPTPVNNAVAWSRDAEVPVDSVIRTKIPATRRWLAFSNFPAWAVALTLFATAIVALDAMGVDHIAHRLLGHTSVDATP